MDSQEASATNDYAESRPDVATAGIPMHPAVGESIQGFEIIGLTPDQGAESDLYHVKSQTGEKYVLKLYRSGVQPATIVDALQIHHPRIVAPILTGAWNGRPYEITPFFECGSLAHLIQRDGPLQLSSAEVILRQLVEGLTVLHHAGIQHRDLKPSNILIKSENPLEVVLTDFGSSALATMTLITQVRTTLAYAAPETLTGMYSRASDYWSLGIILVEMLTGQNPLQWFGPSRVAGYQIVQGKVPIPDALPARWQRLLKGLLERDHYKRWDNTRILFWLNETDEPLNQSRRFRRLIFTGATAAIIACGSLLGVGIWQSTQTVREHSSSRLVTHSTNPLPQSSLAGGRQPAASPLDVKPAPWLAIAVLGFAWLSATGLFLIGFGHCVTGTPHGLAFICAGVAVGVIAFYLPQLL